MPDQQTPNPGASPFEIVTPGKSKKGGRTGIVITILVVIFLILSVVAGVLLVRQQQQIAEKAAANQCPAAQACPYPQQPSLLRNCTPPEADNSPSESLCNTAGRVESCGGQQFCCPSSGGAWTTNMTVCNSLASPSPSPTATPTPTPSPTLQESVSTPTPTETPTATPTLSPTASTVAQTTPRPIPVTGVSWPTAAGIGVGATAIIISILMAL